MMQTFQLTHTTENPKLLLQPKDNAKRVLWSLLGRGCVPFVMEDVTKDWLSSCRSPQIFLVPHLSEVSCSREVEHGERSLEIII